MFEHRYESLLGNGLQKTEKDYLNQICYAFKNGGVSSEKEKLLRILVDYSNHNNKELKSLLAAHFYNAKNIS